MSAAAGPHGPRLPPPYRLLALDSVASTMDEARRLAEEGAEEGTLVWAREQRGGRGRLGRNWYSPRGNLYFTLILRPGRISVLPIVEDHVRLVDEPSRRQPVDTDTALQFLLQALAAVALGEAIGTVSPPVEVTYKWPNDVLLQGSKVAGILLESRAASEERLAYLLLGCGVNVAHFPQDPELKATSMHFEGVPKSVTPEELLGAFSRHVLSRVSRRVEDGFEAIRRAWLRHAAGLGEEILVRLPHEVLKGRFRDLDQEGYLLLEMADGEERRISSGEVFLTERKHAAGDR